MIILAHLRSQWREFHADGGKVDFYVFIVVYLERCNIVLDMTLSVTESLTMIRQAFSEENNELYTTV
jgi:hypothetical protein